jgi:hypothetical protein
MTCLIPIIITSLFFILSIFCPQSPTIEQRREIRNHNGQTFFTRRRTQRFGMLHHAPRRAHWYDTNDDRGQRRQEPQHGGFNAFADYDYD